MFLVLCRLPIDVVHYNHLGFTLMSTLGNLFKPQSSSVNHFHNLKKCFSKSVAVLVDIPTQNWLVHYVSLISYRATGQEPADVLNDIGNMLANLTDELDAMLEEEKRQGLNQWRITS